jgi:hypothetical protein
MALLWAEPRYSTPATDIFTHAGGESDIHELDFLQRKLTSKCFVQGFVSTANYSKQAGRL